MVVHAAGRGRRRIDSGLGIVILCRLSGTHATWRAGFHSPPPQSHAWAEADGEPVRETVDPRTIYTPIITI